MIYVVGSGPAGVSCAAGLLQKGVAITLLDCGLELEDSLSAKVGNLRSLGRERWQPSDLTFLKQQTSSSLSGIPLKYAYGSDFPYRDPGVEWRLETDGVETRPSFAKGGLSTVWGAAVLPYRQEDMKDWPIQEQELAPHYRAVLRFMPLAGGSDSLEQLFPLYSDELQPLEFSQQAKEFLADLQSSAAELERSSIRFGGSRLAVWARPGEHQLGCCYCAQCMYGCPFGAIYSSSATLEALRRHSGFSYVNQVAVDRVDERNDGVTLLAHHLRTGERLQFSGSRVFLACGTLATSKILLQSMDAFDEPVILKDSCYFLLPLLRWRAASGALRQPLHTLAQIFLEIVDPQTCGETIHLQVYTYNELYALALAKLLGPANRLMPTDWLLERLLMIQGYLPSAFSPQVRMVLCKDQKSGLSTLKLSPVENDQTRPTLRRMLGKLRQSARLLRASALGPMLRPGEPGRGFHSGGSFPMREKPDRFQTDKFGRPYGFTRVHAVDATVFPSIPATTITLSVMANAHRIADGLGTY